jgi:predicted transcriptional regulator of viral defense system
MLGKTFMGIQTTRERLLSIVRELGVARLRDFEKTGLHHRYVIDACKEGAIERIGRGSYALPGRTQTPSNRIAEACKRIPQGTVCLLSALWFHRLVAEEPPALWMAIDTKARPPQFDLFPIEFVYASGEALTQGAMNLGIDGVQISVYSPMKTVADCFKYADKVGVDIAPAALTAAVANNKYNRQKLLRFAEICRVKQAVADAEKARRNPQPVEIETGEEDPSPKPARVWDREVLEKQVWSEPIRQLAKKYGVSDVAIHKHCKKMGIKLPGRGYWAKKACQ